MGGVDGERRTDRGQRVEEQREPEVGEHARDQPVDEGEHHEQRGRKDRVDDGAADEEVDLDDPMAHHRVADRQRQRDDRRNQQAVEPERQRDVARIEQHVAHEIAHEAQVEADEHPAQARPVFLGPLQIGLADDGDGHQVDEAERDLQPRVGDVRASPEQADGEVDPDRPRGQYDEQQR